MSRVVVPYGIRFEENGRLATFPVADITVSGTQDASVRALFQIDSGATITVVPLTDAQELHIDLKRGKRLAVRGITGVALPAVMRRLRLTLGGVSFRAPVAFVSGTSIPRILGREGVFSRFSILFAEANRKVAFLENRSEQRLISTLLKQL
mgnify:FL=1